MTKKRRMKVWDRSIESARISSGMQPDGEMASGEETAVPLDNNKDLTKSKQNLTNQADTDAESAVQHNEAETDHNNGKKSEPEVESAENGDNMEAFYESIEVEEANTPTRTRPSKKTQKALQILRDLASKKFSLLLHPGRSILMKDVLEYLMCLPPEDGGVSLSTKSAIHRLATNFARWKMDYENASLKLDSAAAEQSVAVELKGELDANVKGFRELVAIEKSLCTKLASLEEKKRELEEQINVVKADIADFTAHRDKVAKRKREVFDYGKMLKGERDDLRNQEPRLKAAQEWAKIAQANIEADWSRFGEQFIQSLI